MTYLSGIVLFSAFQALEKEKRILETKEGQASDLGQAGEEQVVFMYLKGKKKVWVTQTIGDTIQKEAENVISTMDGRNKLLSDR